MKSENILDGAEDKRTDPKHGCGYIPFAYHLIPLEGLAKVASVMKAGEDRGDNWRKMPIEEHLNHAISHIVGYLKGRHADHHLANACCRVLMALDLDEKEVLPCPSLGPDWAGVEISDEIDLAYSIKETFDDCMAKVAVKGTGKQTKTDRRRGDRRKEEEEPFP